MKLKIVSSNDYITHDVAWLELNTPKGNFVIQGGHVPMILTLSAKHPVIFRLKSGKQKTFYPEHGIAEITREQATIIVNETHD